MIGYKKVALGRVKILKTSKAEAVGCLLNHAPDSMTGKLSVETLDGVYGFKVLNGGINTILLKEVLKHLLK